MESVKRNSDREQNVQMRRLVNDPCSRKKPLKILEQKISVFEKAEHAQVHANARDQPATSGTLICGLAHLTTKPEIHRGGPEQESGKRRVPCAIKNVAGYYEKIFARLPRTDTPVSSDDDDKENDESERIKEHAKAAIESRYPRAPIILFETYRGSV